MHFSGSPGIYIEPSIGQALIQAKNEFTKQVIMEYDTNQTRHSLPLPLQARSFISNLWKTG